MPAPRGLSWWLVVLAAATCLLGTAQGSEDIVERQNPSFITQLPTLPLPTTSSNPVVVVTTTSISTVSPPPVPPTSSLATPGTTTPASAPSPSTTLSASSPSPPSPTASGQESFSFVDDAFFGRVPTVNPDAAVITVFLAVFLFFAVVHALYYRANAGKSKRAPKAALSKLVFFFCLARVAGCLLRLVWIAVSKSTMLIFVALVTENAGTILLIVVNYHLTKQMISFCNLRYSLWARSVIKKMTNVTISIVFATIFLLNTFGIALFEVQVSSGRDPTTEAQLVQAGETLLIAVGLIFNFVVLTTMVTSPWAPVDRLGTKIIIYVVGPGLLTLVSQLMRLIATFMIWKPVTPLSAEFLSKPAFYVTGFGAEVLILTLYSFWDTSLLALTRESLLPRHKAATTTEPPAPQASGDEARPWSVASVKKMLHMSVDSKTSNDDHDHDHDSSAKDLDDLGSDFDDDDAPEKEVSSSTIISTTSPVDNTQDEEAGQVAARAPRPWTLTMFRSSRLPNLRESTIGKAI